MADFARRVTLEVSIDGHDVASVFSAYLLDFTFTDNASGKADDLQISLRNSDCKFSGEWRPKKGMEVVASIICHNWENQGEDLKLPCGSFSIDEVELSGPPDKIQIKAVSASLAGGLRDTKKTRAWENISLKTLAGQIAENNSLELMYIGPDHQFERQDQRNESDISFLTRLAGDFGMNCKAHDGKLILFDSENSEGADSVIEIPKLGGMYSPKSYSFKMSSSGTDYDKAEVAYTDPKTGKTQTAEAKSAKKSAKKKASEKVLTVNQRVENPDQAQKLARAKLHKENQKEQTASLECMGNPALVAGRNVELTGFEEFSGTWCIKSATHKLGGNGGYSVSMELTSPAPTEGGKTESFTREKDEQQRKATTDNEPKLKSWEELGKEVAESGNEIFQLIYCMVEIAAAKAERLKDNLIDAEGLINLSDQFYLWLTNLLSTNPYAMDSPFLVRWEWVMGYERAKKAYEEMIRYPSNEPNTIFNDAAKKCLAQILCNDSKLNPNQETRFDYIGTSKINWRMWEELSYQHKSVHSYPQANPDGLMASLGDFTLLALPKGFTKSIGDNKYKICVEEIAVVVFDKFDFNPEQTLKKKIFEWIFGLGSWNCHDKDGGTLWDIIKPDYLKLDNGAFRSFRDRFKMGHDFLIFSEPHRVETFPGDCYDATCPEFCENCFLL